MGNIRYKIDQHGNIETFRTVSIHKFQINSLFSSIENNVALQAHIEEFLSTPRGKFIKENGKLGIKSMEDPVTGTFRFIVIATLEEKKLTEYYLRWGNL